MKFTSLGRLFFILIIFLFSFAACAPKAQQRFLYRDIQSPPKIILETFAQEGKSDYILKNDDGYSYRLIYLCENRVFNFSEEPENNPILVSLQPVLDTTVEILLSFDDRVRIWACMERKVREEQSRIEEIKRRTMEEIAEAASELGRIRDEHKKLQDEIEKRKRVALQKQRQIEEEARRAERLEEERLRKAEEEQRRRLEEERKIKFYRSQEKEEPPPPPPPPPKSTETGIFLVMKDTNVYEDLKEPLKIRAKVKKYDLFDVVNSKKDPNGSQWFQILLGERLISERQKRTGWVPEEKSFWVRNKIPAWVYPSDLSKAPAAKPVRIDPELLTFTGKKSSVPNKPPFFEVTYDVKTETIEKTTGWVEEKSGVRRPNKTIDEMRLLLNELSMTLWPIRVQNDILSGNIRIGFTPEQVFLAWGKPDHVNRTKTLVGIHEQWVYGENPFPRSYVYIENGLVKSWEFLKPAGK